MSVSLDGMVFDEQRVRSLLGLRKARKERPAPSPLRPDERIVYLPPSVQSPWYLRDETKAPMWKDQVWYDNHWAIKAQPGYWAVILPVPGSRDKTYEERNLQLRREFPGYQRTPMLVGTLLLSLELLATGNDLAQQLWIQCPENAEGNLLFGLCVVHRKVRVVRSNGRELGFSMSAARWICP